MAEAMLDSGVSAVTLCSLLDQNTFTTQFDVTKWNSHANMCSCFRAGANAKSQNIVCLPHGRLWFPLCVLACVCVCLPVCVCVSPCWEASVSSDLYVQSQSNLRCYVLVCCVVCCVVLCCAVLCCVVFYFAAGDAKLHLLRCSYVCSPEEAGRWHVLSRKYAHT